MRQRLGHFLGRLTTIPPPPPVRESGRRALRLRDYALARTLPLIAIHVGAIVGIFLGAPWPIWLAALALAWVRMFGVTAGYHRYFSHRSFKTSRVMQFLFALLAQSSSQRGALWWAAHHRGHHKYSDEPRDIHSPQQHGFWHAHMGWLYDGNDATDYGRVKDLARFPELVALNKLWWLPPIALAAAITTLWGWAGLLVVFALSTVAVWHTTFAINSLAHVWGKRRYETTDDSRNNWFFALLSLGEGWHNNHHHFMGSARQGFFWWEIDVTYYVLRVMSWLGLVWDIKSPPSHVYDPASAIQPAPVPVPLP